MSIRSRTVQKKSDAGRNCRNHLARPNSQACARKSHAARDLIPCTRVDPISDGTKKRGTRLLKPSRETKFSGAHKNKAVRPGIRSLVPVSIRSRTVQKKAGAGRDCRNRLARPNSQARTRKSRSARDLIARTRADPISDGTKKN